jgi:tRNA-dihydrouridine synthase A
MTSAMLHYPLLKINAHMAEPLISVAPMMGCTDRHFRYLLRLISPRALLYTEMVTTGALLNNDPDRFLAHRADEPAALQLGGNEPKALARCAKLAEIFGYQEVNMNVGCPSDRVQEGGIGACLMATPRLVADCFLAMSEVTSLPVTIKSRIGIDDQDSYDDFHTFISTLYDAGCRDFIVHARKAVLKGLSPKENREIPPLKYDFVYRIATAFPDARFTINGGLKTVEETKEALSHLPAAMLGRAIYDNPWTLNALDHALFGDPISDRHRIIEQYRAYLEEELDKGTRLKHMTRHLLTLFQGKPGARAYRRYLSTHMYEELAGIEVFDQACALVQTDEQLTG